MSTFTEIDAVAAGIALAFVVVVWAMSPSIGGRRRAFKDASREVGATTRGMR